MTDPKPHQEQLKDERWELLRNVSEATEKLMVALAFVWLGLLVLDFTVGLDPLLQTLNSIVWALFILDFAVEFIIAPEKGTYLRNNWLTAVSLALPALRIVRVLRAARILSAARVTRTLGLVRLVSSFNRGMRAIQLMLGRQGVGTLVVITILVLFIGAAGIWAFERPGPGGPEGLPGTGSAALLNSFGDAVWWTAMILTTLGSEYWPRTAEGRILCWLLSLYALGVFSYVTATVATYFIGINQPKLIGAIGSGTPDTAVELARLREELAAIRAQLAAGDAPQPLPNSGDE